MIRIHDRDIRGKTQMGWLDSRHTFSFGHFMDPTRMGFKSLRVINDDRVIPGAGFDTHGHKNMEIITYVLEGALAHKDSLGTGSVINKGDLQKMSAGSGILHSEFNASNDNPVHFLQIWIMPDKANIAPSYEQKTLSLKKGEFTLVGSSNVNDNAITIHQNIKMYIARLDDLNSVSYSFDAGRSGFIHVAKGMINLNGEDLKEGDGAEVSDLKTLNIQSKADETEIILFDLK